MPKRKGEDLSKMEYFQIRTARHNWRLGFQERLLEDILPRAAKAGAPVHLIREVAVSRKPPLKARVNESRWIVDCPDCPAVVFAPHESGLMICLHCWNSRDEFKWRRVEYPDERSEIEAVLSRRFLEKHRNWSPGESVADLVRENAEHKGEVM